MRNHEYGAGAVTAVSFSPNGTTGKWAGAVARGAAARMGRTVRALDITFCAKTPVEAGHFGPDDLVVIGMPVYVGYIPSVAAEWLRGISGERTACVLAASYGNRDYGKCLSQMERIVRERGFLPVGAAAFSSRHCLAPDINADRPDDGDLKEAAAFGARIGGGLMDEGIERMSLAPGDIPEGKAMNREADMMAFPAQRVMTSLGALPGEPPTPGPGCNGCGTCGNVCPTGAIGPDGKAVDFGLCLVCCACIASCPEHALDFTQPEFRRLRRGCVEKFGTPRKEPRYFLRE